MSVDERNEIRVSVQREVYIVSARDPRAPDLVVTESVSTNGVRLVTKRPWDVGECHWVTPAPGNVHLQAHVVYCKPRSNGGFDVGLRLRNSFANWWEGPVEQRPPQSVRPYGFRKAVASSACGVSGGRQDTSGKESAEAFDFAGYFAG